MHACVYSEQKNRSNVWLFYIPMLVTQKIK
jgi:hypothetical protein